MKSAGYSRTCVLRFVTCRPQYKRCDYLLFFLRILPVRGHSKWVMGSPGRCILFCSAFNPAWAPRAVTPQSPCSPLLSPVLPPALLPALPGRSRAPPHAHMEALWGLPRTTGGGTGAGPRPGALSMTTANTQVFSTRKCEDTGGEAGKSRVQRKEFRLIQFPDQRLSKDVIQEKFFNFPTGQ